ncbi:hypothetical protein [Rhodalgimonas zhirmunskyi]|uniref:Uncharacterized protein n=1 Tax=Rhodalgimonas zhirmunskyi TaxID=2964767 RepID=A0AAJ1U4V2_9RHOB|nr:hypothetical protein [Rhodoalgimonas zhirmunskyi]MDQ2093721.1 hypothetical protein [Rhodoalgimonas zhirmunskyi]
MAREKELFDKRVRRVARKHQRMANGFTPVVQRDGLISVRPRRVAPRVPIKGLFLLIAGFVLFKAVAIANVSLPTYEERLDMLRAGTVFEQAGAFLLQPDQLSVALGAQLAPLLN